MNPRHYLLAVLLAGLTSLSGQHKWDKDSIYLAEFGRDTVVAPEVALFAVHVSPFRALVGIVSVDAEVQLDQNKSLLFGFTHASAIYRYGQPNVPEQSLLLNHYGSYIYEEWIFENVMAVDLRHYWTKKTLLGQYKTRYVAVVNRFALTRWDYTTAIISNTLYTSSDDDVWNGASPWIPLDFDDLRPRYENSYRFGLAYGHRRRLPATRFFKYREFTVAGVVRYDRWREQTLLIPQLKWTFVY
ncbi:MAG: hypothetical protein O2862_08975 [Bacteroidetes bacterium]|nr:hypothetical protein [Bacteroidota bacterium]